MPYTYLDILSHKILLPQQQWKQKIIVATMMTLWTLGIQIPNQTCPKGFGLKLAKLTWPQLGLEIPLKNKVKQKQS